VGGIAERLAHGEGLEREPLPEKGVDHGEGGRR
jgi:hypothetical protein